MNNIFIKAFFQSGIAGKAIILALVGMSIYTWAIIGNRFSLFKKLKQESEWFLDNFRKHHHHDIFALYTKKLSGLNSYIPVLYKEACRELARFLQERESRTITRDELNMIENMLYKNISELMVNYNRSLSVLATSASTGPLLGLFGTVWGIMDVFDGIGMKGSISIGSVAPGIAEALATTVAGLIVAIPAAVSYNYFIHTVKMMHQEMNNFSMEMIITIEKQYVLTAQESYEQVLS